jgi:hypothetical protein
MWLVRCCVVGASGDCGGGGGAMAGLPGEKQHHISLNPSAGEPTVSVWSTDPEGELWLTAEQTDSIANNIATTNDFVDNVARPCGYREVSRPLSQLPGVAIASHEPHSQLKIYYFKRLF